MNNDNNGYFTFHREWIHSGIRDNPFYMAAWVDILDKVNFKKKSVVIDNRLYICERAEKLYSLETWVATFNKGKRNAFRWWSVAKVRTFFKMLKTIGMIEYSGEERFTRIKVLKYGLEETEELTNEELLQKGIYSQFDKLSLTLDEFNGLIDQGYTKADIDHKIIAIQNNANNYKYKSLYLTLLLYLKDVKKMSPTGGSSSGEALPVRPFPPNEQYKERDPELYKTLLAQYKKDAAAYNKKLKTIKGNSKK